MLHKIPALTWNLKIQTIKFSCRIRSVEDVIIPVVITQRWRRRRRWTTWGDSIFYALWIGIYTFNSFPITKLIRSFYCRNRLIDIETIVDIFNKIKTLNEIKSLSSRFLFPMLTWSLNKKSPVIVSNLNQLFNWSTN